MKKIIFTLGLFLFLLLTVKAQFWVTKPRVENITNPIGLGTQSPGFSWQMESDQRDMLQSAYEIRVYTDLKSSTPFWTSGKKLSSQSTFVAYKGNPLRSGKKYYWQVNVWDNKATAPVTSEWSSFQMGMLAVNDWKAKWIGPGYAEDSLVRPCPLLRKEFATAKKIISATAFITAHGMYEAFINGKRIGDAYFTPGWTAYKERLQYQTYDVTDLLKNGANALAVILGNGWYRGIIGFSNNQNVYGKDISLLLQLDIHYSDGSTETIVSDGSWKSATGAIRYAEIYNGETIDKREERTGWDLPGYDDSRWSGVKTAQFSLQPLVAGFFEPVRKKEVFQPLKIITTPNGEKVLDFGQNLVGWVTLQAKGNPGDKIIVSHAEVLDKQGNFYTANLRAAKSQDTYFLKGGEWEVFEPHFTWHGFRYIKLEGYPGEIKPENFTAVAMYSDMEKTGEFQSSNSLINQLQHNIEWGQKGNFLDVPTDCPQRDERLGWTGDAQVFSRTAAFNMDVHNFFSKWLKDMEADQLPNGSIPFVIPNVLGENAAGSAGWADAVTIIPWNMYLAYGDTGLLATQYNSMKKWVGYMREKSRKDLWNTGFHFGDWLFFRPDDDNDGKAAVTDKYLIAQCFYAHSTQLLINAARVLGKAADVQEYSSLLQNIKAAYLKEYLSANGRLISGTQTAYVLSLQFDMLPENLRQQAADRLVENIKAYNNHLTTGFLGTPYLCYVLTQFGYTDMAYTLLLQEKYPSWLYPVKMGATTIWERWDGIKPNGSFQVPSMNSYNHYAYGAIGDWMYRVMAGLDTYEDGTGYKHSRIQPHPGGGFTHASASLKTLYGTLSSSWKTAPGEFLMDVTIPANTTATVFIPSGKEDIIKEGENLINGENTKRTEGYMQVNIGSGKYRFSVVKKSK